MPNSPLNPGSGWKQRLTAIVGITLLHIICYYLANSINSLRAPEDFIHFQTIVDTWLPYVGWTWVFYYFGDVYILFWGALVFWKLPQAGLRPAIYAYAGMIVTGAATQLILPGDAPWPAILTPAQQFVHDLIDMRPYACLPSMHVALTVLPAGLALSVLGSRWLKNLSTVAAILITASTLTLKEHYFVDTVAGLGWGLIFYAYWWRIFNPPRTGRPVKRKHGYPKRSTV